MTAAFRSISPRVYEWMRTKLVADTAVTAVFGQRVYAEMIPQQVDYDTALVMQYMGGGKVAVTNGIRVMENGLYSLTATGKPGTYASLRDGMDAAGAALNRKSGSVANVAVIWCEYLNEIPNPPLAYSGEAYERIAFMFKVQAHET